VCIGLGEAWDRGLLRAHTTAYSSTFQLENRSGDEDICIDNWYVWRSVDSQDLGAGDMDADFGDAYPYGSMTLSAGGDVYYPYGAVRDESWWCMEQTQYTQARKNYTFTGARVPEPLLTYMLDGDQDGVWRWMEDHPVMIGGRGTNYVEVGRGGGTAEITLQLTNMGSVAGAAELRETLPYGWSASGASPAEARTETAADGGTVLVFETALDARVLTDVYDDTLYDTQTFTYTLAIPPCTGRQILTPMETRWRDADGARRAGTANPLVVNCL